MSSIISSNVSGPSCRRRTRLPLETSAAAMRQRPRANDGPRVTGLAAEDCGLNWVDTRRWVVINCAWSNLGNWEWGVEQPQNRERERSGTRPSPFPFPFPFPFPLLQLPYSPFPDPHSLLYLGPCSPSI